MTIQLRMRTLIISVVLIAGGFMAVGWQFGHSDITRIDPRYFEPTAFAPVPDDGAVRSPWYTDRSIIP